MRRISHILARTVFPIALTVVVIAAASGCGQNKTADATDAEESSASDISSAKTADTAAESSLSAEDKELLADSADQFSSVFGDTSEFSVPLSDGDQGSFPSSDSAKEDLFGTDVDPAVNAPFADMTGNPAASGGSTQSTATEFSADDLGTPAGTVPESSGTQTEGGAADAAAADALAAAIAQSSGPIQTEGEKTAAAALEDGLPERTSSDTALKESVLSAALVECTGWGQSTGSSLHAALAATSILDWSNQAVTSNVDSAALSETIKAEYDRLSPEQRDNLKNNWSFISYDVETMLDSFSELEGILSDAGCLETAKAAVADKKVLDNWKATHDALEAAMK